MSRPIKPGDFVRWDGVTGQVREGQYLGPAPGDTDAKGDDFFAAVRSHNAVCHIRVSALRYHEQANVNPEDVLNGKGVGGGYVPHTLPADHHFEAWVYKGGFYLVYTDEQDGNKTVARYIGPAWQS